SRLLSRAFDDTRSELGGRCAHPRPAANLSGFGDHGFPGSFPSVGLSVERPRPARIPDYAREARSLPGVLVVPKTVAPAVGERGDPDELEGDALRLRNACELGLHEARDLTRRDLVLGLTRSEAIVLFDTACAGQGVRLAAPEFVDVEPACDGECPR